MEISIDLKMMKEIAFRDESLLQQMLAEWKDDSNMKIREIRNAWIETDPRRLFYRIHELKTNFTMLHCHTAIRLAEQMVRDLEMQLPVRESDLNALEGMVLAIQRKLEPENRSDSGEHFIIDKPTT
ncbi:MAG TPA: hypothetical protein VFX48_07570 [Saprospiraceae bacterium]|nr:hypothetical protein [Saprospiraceae bacterium]